MSALELLIPAAAVVAVPAISGLVAKASGGPLRTRRSKRLLDQVEALEKSLLDPQTGSDKSTVLAAAAIQHKEALAQEMAKSQASYSPAVASLLGSLVYIAIGLGANGSDGEPQVEFLWLAAILALIAATAFVVIGMDRRAMVQRALGTESFPFLPPVRRAAAEAKAKELESKDARNLARQSDRQRKAARRGQWIANQWIVKKVWNRRNT